MTQRAGLRRFVVRVEKHDGTRTADGVPTLTNDSDWDTVIAGLSCSIEAVTGGEVIRGRQMEATATHLVQVLSTPRTRAIQPNWRLVWGTRKLNILSNLDAMGRQEDLALQAREHVNDG